MANTIQTQSTHAQTNLSASPYTRFVIPLMFIVITFIVFGTQSGGVGFWKGSHGWTSSHTLAVMSHATPGNLFAGYALADRSADGHTGYLYFDRYPFFLSATVNAIISVTDDLSTKVFLARQFMLAVHVATIAFAFLLVKRLVQSPYLALSIVLLAFTGYNFIYYSDQINFDQPALMGMILLLYVIMVYKQEHNHHKRWLYLAALFAVSLGRGYSSFFVLGLWFVAETVGILIKRNLSIGQRIKQIATHDVTRILILALVWTSVFLAYNIVIEALRRGVSIEQTSVVESALRRLPFGHSGDGRNLTTMSEGVAPPWSEFAQLEMERIIRWFTPFNLGWDTGEIAGWALPLGLLALGIVLIYILRQRQHKRLLAFLTACGGIAWTAFMINQAANHEFSTMYGLGIALIFYTALLAWLKHYPRLSLVALLACGSLFSIQHYRVYAENVDEIRSYDVYTQDYNRILHQIEGSGRSIYHTFPNNCAIENSKCFVLGFYLDDNYITRDLDAADYILTGYDYHTSKPFLLPGDTEGLQLVSHSLTPENTVAHLFAARAAEVRHLPEDVHPLFYFGDSYTLHHWELRDSVQVQRCQRVYLESWWQMAAQPQHNDSLQIALVNADGQAVSSANSPLTTVPTKVWIPDAYFLDARSIQVPCEVPAGDYSLVMSIYNPDTVATAGSLPVTLPDGSPFNDYVYLTTLHVSD